MQEADDDIENEDPNGNAKDAKIELKAENEMDQSQLTLGNDEV